MTKRGRGVKVAKASARLGDSAAGWRDLAAQLEGSVLQELRGLGIKAARPPEHEGLERFTEGCVIHGPFRWLCAWVLFPPLGADPGFYVHVATCYEEPRRHAT
jgi:hypothetical protein